LIEFLDDYAAGALPPGEQAEFDRHLAECPPCVAFLQNYRATIKAERAAYADPRAGAPPQAPQELVRAILAARPGLPGN
jgi:anti-sigma factor RsiW